MSTMDLHQLAALPAVLDVPTAAAALGLSRTTAYELIRTGEWPTPVFRLGRLIRIPTAPILELLGIDPRAGGFAEAVPVSTQVVVPTTHERRNVG
ncbi:MAG TPA: helix-turn-helix domain-containing protein [Kineosporiaceae bacterium]|nr:helix-turn-helix domain-containing protein [Kineosporiaceae bacterium]